MELDVTADSCRNFVYGSISLAILVPNLKSPGNAHNLTLTWVCVESRVSFGMYTSVA